MFQEKKVQSILLWSAIFLGVLAGYSNYELVFSGAKIVSEIFINLLKLVSLPVIFFSILSTVSGMDSLSEIKILGKKVIKYTLFTTVIAATIALFFFVIFDPVQNQLSILSTEQVAAAAESKAGYMDYLVNVIPSNFIQPFVESNVISVLFLSILLSLATISLPTENRKSLHMLFSSLYAAIMKITTWIVQLMPLAIWAFITLFIQEIKLGLEIKSLALYLLCIVLANIVQALIVLPLLLKSKKISPLALAQAVFPALSLAFFTKSSGAALPLAMKCIEEKAGVSRKIASFSMPLCTTINMNACAAFILTTVLFVSMSYGMTFTAVEMIAWIFIATLAAVGNASVPMGCYFLASAFLAAMNVPLHILGVILPFYAMIDMLESAINVWSDCCVTAIVQKEIVDPVADEARAPELIQSI